MDAKRHWEKIYTTKSPTEVSWYQREPTLSLELIVSAAPSRDAAIIDVGGGASALASCLLRAGYANLTVLDIAESALDHARHLLGGDAPRVRWVCDDVLAAAFPARGFDLWHDRAVFHFLTSFEDRQKYVEQVARAVRPGGYVIVATFAEDGPLHCSGLDVARYDATSLHAVFGKRFRLLKSIREEHVTPSGGRQSFQYCVCSLESMTSTAAA